MLVVDEIAVFFYNQSKNKEFISEIVKRNISCNEKKMTHEPKKGLLFLPYDVMELVFFFRIIDV